MYLYYNVINCCIQINTELIQGAELQGRQRTVNEVTSGTIIPYWEPLRSNTAGDISLAGRSPLLSRSEALLLRERRTTDGFSGYHTLSKYKQKRDELQVMSQGEPLKVG